jgi:ribosomal protein L44E
MTELTVAEIDAQIKALQAKKRSINKTPRTPRTPRVTKTQKPTKHQRKIVCSNCGQADTRANLIRISKFEYEHPMCPASSTRVVRIDFTL